MFAASNVRMSAPSVTFEDHPRKTGSIESNPSYSAGLKSGEVPIDDEVAASDSVPESENSMYFQQPSDSEFNHQRGKQVAEKVAKQALADTKLDSSPRLKEDENHYGGYH